MIFRSLFSGILAAGALIANQATAQIILCPSAPDLKASQSESRAEAEILLERLLIALDLHGYESIDVEAILRTHAETPGALLAKLGNVADRCARADKSDLEAFYKAIPGLRQAFFEATLIDGSGSDQASAASLGHQDRAAIDALSDAAQLERSTNLSVRSLWRRLWFRSPSNANDPEARWAVIVASPAGLDEGWQQLGELQKTWEDVYFQLHRPYYEGSDYYAIVVGKKLPGEEAERLLPYVKELGMADDSYTWPVPVDETINVVSSEKALKETQHEGTRKNLDLSVLNN